MSTVKEHNSRQSLGMSYDIQQAGKNPNKTYLDISIVCILQNTRRFENLILASKTWSQEFKKIARITIMHATNKRSQNLIFYIINDTKINYVCLHLLNFSFYFTLSPICLSIQWSCIHEMFIVRVVVRTSSSWNSEWKGVSTWIFFLEW